MKYFQLFHIGRKQYLYDLKETCPISIVTYHDKFFLNSLNLFNTVL